LRCVGNGSSHELEGNNSPNWGTLGDWQSCPDGEFLGSYAIKVEPEQRTKKDDSSANDVKFQCRQLSSSDTSSSSVLTSDNGGPWGNWSQFSACPQGTAICGFQAKIQASQGDKEDTALNDLKFKCCPLPLLSES